jgi:hypothetical protein
MSQHGHRPGGASATLPAAAIATIKKNWRMGAHYNKVKFSIPLPTIL